MKDDLINAYLNCLYFENAEPNDLVYETSIDFGGKHYPQNGQVVIVAGGPGSGKGFIIDTLFAIDVKRVDPDHLKMLIKNNAYIQNKLAKQYDVDPKIFEMTTPEDVSVVHVLLKQIGLMDRYLEMIYTTAANAPEDRKPNLIFDRTIKDFSEFVYSVNQVKNIGYKPENIHFIWVLNDVNLALKQNSERERKLDENLLKSIHNNCARNMKFIFDLGEKISDYLNGDIWIVFNNREKDMKTKELNVGKYSKTKSHLVEDSNIVKIKSSGEPFEGLPNELTERIIEYVPENTWS
jgi:hypothetical protein